MIFRANAIDNFLVKYIGFVFMLSYIIHLRPLLHYWLDDVKTFRTTILHCQQNNSSDRLSPLSWANNKIQIDNSVNEFPNRHAHKQECRSINDTLTVICSSHQQCSSVVRAIDISFIWELQENIFFYSWVNINTWNFQCIISSILTYKQYITEVGWNEELW